ncbi:hypothetical protein O3M35_005950 [Rhynocoris fuscipes]|uniref:Sulfite oxidase n=1 Tax=Rhynocoris fuscipes TaxID=488301 RepID=A0AAW1DBI1_9HEMI
MPTISRFVQHLFKKNINSFNSRVACSLISYNSENQQRYNDGKYNNHYKKIAIGAGVSLGFGLSFLTSKKEVDEEITGFGSPLPNLPTYKLTEIAEHSSKEKGIWVTYRHGVYDISEFIELHPGGDIILMAAGGSIDPFWNLYAIHKQDHILEMLEKYRIGNLDKEDAKGSKDDSDPYAWEPRRHPALMKSSDKPFCAEPPTQFLIQSHITPQELFFVRNHLPVPDVDPETYELEIEGIGIEGTKTFTLDDLKKLPKHTVTATIMCCGNRRGEMSKIKMIKGLNWGAGAIGTAEWTGVKLCDFLRSLGVSEDSKAEHVQFEGLDTDATNTSFGGSIPLVRALDPRSEVILAYEMNGKPLSRDHGFPLRAIVPGVAGARNVKWLSRIIVSENESDSHWQKNDYKGFSPNVDWDNVDFSSAPAVQELPVISAICTPLNGDVVHADVDDNITVKGYAWSGGGRNIIRVDLTCDHGKTWHTAKLLDKEKKSKAGDHVWDWTLWEAKIPLPKHADKEIDIQVKAVDSAYSTQPEYFENIWNLRGVANNAYHRVKVKVNK